MFSTSRPLGFLFQSVSFFCFTFLSNNEDQLLGWTCVSLGSFLSVESIWFFSSSIILRFYVESLIKLLVFLFQYFVNFVQPLVTIRNLSRSFESFNFIRHFKKSVGSRKVGLSNILYNGVPGKCMIKLMRLHLIQILFQIFKYFKFSQQTECFYLLICYRIIAYYVCGWDFKDGSLTKKFFSKY